MTLTTLEYGDCTAQDGRIIEVSDYRGSTVMQCIIDIRVGSSSMVSTSRGLVVSMMNAWMNIEA